MSQTMPEIVSQPKHILIVDDEELNCELLAALVESFGHTSQIARNGREALSKISSQTDLVLLDAMMPLMDGFQVARQMRADPNEQIAHVPIVMVTALTSKEDRLRAVEAGANDFITKPIDRTELRVRTHSLLKMKEAQDAVKRREEDLRAKNAIMQADLELARAMQQAFILKSYPTFPAGVAPHESALAFLHRYLPATSLGGDFFDVLQLSSTRCGIFICDVMGHGVRSALVTAMMRALVGERNSVAGEPAQFLSAINNQLLGILDQAQSAMFASAFYMIADLENHTISYANAGHPSPIRVRRDTKTAQRLVDKSAASGPALGVFAQAEYQTTTCEMNADDFFLLFTDGIFEVENQAEDEEYGEDRVLESVAKNAHLAPDEILDALLQDVKSFAGREDFEDDVCLLGVANAR